MRELLVHFKDVRETGSGWMARCPAHEDSTASLKIDTGDAGRVLLHCHAGCTYAAIVEAAGLTAADLKPATSASTIAHTYDYRDDAGVLIFQVCRFEPKDFRQRRPDGSGGWIWNTKGIAPLVYRRDELAGKTSIVVAEGEKDVDRLWTLGLPATCNHGGAGKWKSHTAQLKEAGAKKIVVIPDNDAPGTAHANTVARSCAAAGLAVKVVTIPAPAKDVSSWLDSGATKAELLALIKAAPAFSDQVAVGEPAGDTAVLVAVSSVKREAVDWVWRHRFARGKLCIVGGEPGEGKSTMLLDVAARCSRGDRWPDGGHAPLGSVLLLSAEDGIADTIAPRLDAHGADDARVHVLTAIQATDGTTRGLDLARDLPQLEAAMRQLRPVFVVIDPISAYLPKIDSWRDNDVRSVLAPLAALAEKYGCVIVAVMHLTKNAGAKILHRLLGSVGFVAAARVVLAVATDPDDPSRRLLLPVKNNLAPPADVLAFTRDDSGRIVWDDAPIIGVTADGVMGAGMSDPHERQDAEAFLREVLAGDQPVLSTDVLKGARANGISDRTLNRAKARLNVKSKLVGFGQDGRWYWFLPAAAESATQTHVATSAENPRVSQRLPEIATQPATEIATASEIAKEIAKSKMATSEDPLTKTQRTTEIANRCKEEDRDGLDY